MFKSTYAVIILIFAIRGDARQLTDAEKSKLPPLYELDDYNTCLSKEDGLYCIGSLHLTPVKRPHEIYDLIEEHSSNPYYFNRTFIRRGWCFNAQDANTSSIKDIFEMRGNLWANAHGMNARLHQLHHCRTYENKVDQITPEQKLFLQVLLAIVTLNLVGTAYDVMTRNSAQRSKLLLAWSIPANWNKLTAINENNDPNVNSFDGLHGIRVISLAFMFYAHVITVHFPIFVTNPEVLEQIILDTRGVFLSNGANIVHMFLTLTSTLTTYNLLQYSEKRPLELRMIPMCIYKRVIRIAPVYVLIVAYGATWYNAARAGPMSDYVIKGYSETCANKFWSHVLFLNNVIDKEEGCLLPSWYLAVDMHLYILACTLTLLLWRYKEAKRLYACLCLGSLFAHIVIYYTSEYEGLVFMAKVENLRVMFENVPSFWHYYTSTWGALPNCFAGLYLGHLQFELHKKSSKILNNKWAKFLHCLNFPLLIFWTYITSPFPYSATSQLAKTTFTIIDKIVYMTFSSTLFMGAINIDGPKKRFFAWRGWRVFSRMSLCVMICHWAVACIIAAKPYAYQICDLDLTVDSVATFVLSYAIALPVTLLVEYPFQKFFDGLI